MRQGQGWDYVNDESYDASLAFQHGLLPLATWQRLPKYELISQILFRSIKAGRNPKYRRQCRTRLWLLPKRKLLSVLRHVSSHHLAKGEKKVRFYGFTPSSLIVLMGGNPVVDLNPNKYR